MTQLRPCIALDGTQSETCRFQHLVGIDHLLPVNQTMMARQPERHWPSIRFPAVSAVQRYCILRKASSYFTERGCSGILQFSKLKYSKSPFFHKDSAGIGIVLPAEHPIFLYSIVAYRSEPCVVPSIVGQSFVASVANSGPTPTASTLPSLQPSFQAYRSS